MTISAQQIPARSAPQAMAVSSSNSQSEIGISANDAAILNRQPVSEANSVMMADMKKRRKKSKVKPWVYVLIGVGAVIIVGVSAIAPHGINSQTGVY